MQTILRDRSVCECERYARNASGMPVARAESEECAGEPCLLVSSKVGSN